MRRTQREGPAGRAKGGGGVGGVMGGHNEKKGREKERQGAPSWRDTPRTESEGEVARLSKWEQ